MNLTTRDKKILVAGVATIVTALGINEAIRQLAKKTPLRELTTSVTNLFCTAIFQLCIENIKSDKKEE